MDESFLIYCSIGFIIAIFCGTIGSYIMDNKGRSAIEGFALGFLLGIIGLLIIAILPTDTEGLKEMKIERGEGKLCYACRSLIDPHPFARIVALINIHSNPLSRILDKPHSPKITPPEQNSGGVILGIIMKPLGLLILPGSTTYLRLSDVQVCANPVFKCKSNYFKCTVNFLAWFSFPTPIFIGNHRDIKGDYFSVTN